MPDQTALYAQFRTGQVDLIIGTGIPANFYAEAVKLPGRKVAKIPSASLEIMMPNLEHPALSDKAVRQALYASINKQAIIDVIYYGLHKPTESFTPQESWAYNPNLPKQVYDLAKANKLLDDAGWKRSGSGVRMKNGVPLEFAVSTTTGAALREQCQQLMMQDWQQIGVYDEDQQHAGGGDLGRFLYPLEVPVAAGRHRLPDGDRSRSGASLCLATRSRPRTATAPTRCSGRTPRSTSC